VKKLLVAGLCAAGLVALVFGPTHSAPKPGSTLSVRALQARLMSQPQFLGTSVATLRRGAQVNLVKTNGSWYLVSYQGQQGWLHENRVTDKTIKLSSGETGSGTTRGEAELAGRGFSPKTETDYKASNPKLDYTHLDKMQEQDVELDSVAKFVEEGEVKVPKGGGK
jgi:hypothetical protein